MNPDRDKRLADLFAKALELPGAERTAFLDEACGSDESLRRDLERLLAHDTTGDDLAGDDVLGRARDMLADAVAGESQDRNLPETLGPYRILDKIGEGGMGTVYLARQSQPRRRVALKMIRSDSISPNLMKRFQFEAEILGRLKHPGIAQIFEAGEIDTPAGRLPYFAMEYVEGAELRRYAREQNLGVREKLELVARIADAVHHAHQKGIVHRDLKPENVLVVEETEGSVAGEAAEYARLGRPKVLDFGVARATDADVQMTTLQTDVGQLVGTITYMSPEQVEGDSRLLDVRSDIYTIGVLLYELLAGRPPFDLKRRSIPDAARIIREEEPTRLGSIQTVFRGDIDTIAYKALEKDRDRRYASAADLAADIRRFLSNEPIIAHPPSTFYEIKKFARRHKGLVGGLVIAFLILLIGIASSLVFAVRATQNEKMANRTAHRLKVTTAQSLGSTDPRLALEYLEEVPAEFRGWEWNHQYARFVSHLVSRKGDSGYANASIIARRPDGRLVAALNRRGAVEIEDIATGDVLNVVDGPQELRASALSPDGALLSVWCRPGKKMQLFDVGRKSCLLEFPSEESEPFSRISPDNDLWAIRSHESGLTTVLDIATGEKQMEGGRKTYYNCMAFGHGGDTILLQWEHDLNVFSRRGELLASTDLEDGNGAIAFSEDGRRLAVGQGQRTIKILDAYTLNVEKVLRGHNKPIRSVAFSRDGAHLASASWEGTVRVWDLSTAQTLRVMSVPGADICSLKFSNDGSMLAAGNPSDVRAWKWTEDSHRTSTGHDSFVYMVSIDPHGSTLASSSYLGDVRLWDAITGDPLAVFSADNPHDQLGWSPSADRLIYSNKGASDFLGTCHFTVLDTGAGVALTAPRLGSDDAIFNALHEDHDLLRVVPNGRRTGGGGEWWVSSYDGVLRAEIVDEVEIRIRQIATNETIKQIGPHEKRVRALAFSPDSSQLVTGDKEGVARIWDLESGALRATLRGHTEELYSLCFSPDQTRLASGGNDCNIVLWDTTTYERVSVLRGHTSYVHAVRFSRDGTMIASASGDGTVRVWDSVLPSERWRQVLRDQALRREAEPLVDQLLEDLGDPLEVADHLRNDEELEGDLRRVALRCLLLRSPAAANVAGSNQR